jgi:lysozyme
MMDMDRLRADLTRHEGVENIVYKCTAGYATIGVGHNLETKPLSQAAIAQILTDDINDAVNDCQKAIIGFSGFPGSVQEALVNMAFNLGITGLLRFTNTLAYLEDHKWLAAADEMLDSKWADQVGNRAIEVSNMVRLCAEA